MQALKQYITQTYSSVRYKSKRRGDPEPSFTKQELTNWLYRNGLESKWIAYLESGRDRDLKPSIDRIDDYGIYEFGNMQLITWKENQLKGVNGDKHHKACHNRQNKKSVLLIKDKSKGIKFNSVKDCAEWLGVHIVSVSRALTGVRKTIKGYTATYPTALTGEELKIQE